MRNKEPGARRVVAGIFWFTAAGVLVTSRKDVGTLFEWHELLFISWLIIRIGFFSYAGVLLWDADEEIDSLRQNQVRLEQIIGEAQRRGV
jgi:hypothetical protein